MNSGAGGRINTDSGNVSDRMQIKFHTAPNQYISPKAVLLPQLLANLLGACVIVKGAEVVCIDVAPKSKILDGKLKTKRGRKIKYAYYFKITKYFCLFFTLPKPNCIIVISIGYTFQSLSIYLFHVKYTNIIYIFHS